MRDTTNRHGLVEDEATCGNPCAPDMACEACELYWQRMRDEGFWKDGAWTDKGMREMLK